MQYIIYARQPNHKTITGNTHTTLSAIEELDLEAVTTKPTFVSMEG